MAWPRGPLEGSTRGCQLLGTTLNSDWNSRCVCQLDSSPPGGSQGVVIPLRQVVQACVDLVQHGVDGCLYCCSGKITNLAFRADIHRHTLFHVASGHCGLVHPQGSLGGRSARRHIGRVDGRGKEGGGRSLNPCAH